MDKLDFQITRADGSKTNPVSVFLAPADEPNECHTVAMIGHFGGRESSEWPKSVEIVGI